MVASSRISSQVMQRIAVVPPAPFGPSRAGDLALVDGLVEPVDR
ncbi:hypothetical protein [Streptomyces canus]